MKRLHSVSLFCLLLLSSVVYAGWNVPVTNYAVAYYAAGTQNWQLVTTGNGWLYAANNYGLLEYDGSQWRVYGMYYGNLPRSIAKLDNSAIFIGATNDFGVFTPTSQGGMRYTSLMSEEIEPNYGEVWDIEIVGTQVYFFARHRIITAIIRNQHGSADRKKSEIRNQISEDSLWLSDVRVISVESRVFCAEEIGGAIYVGTDNGLYLLTGTRMNRIHGSDILHGYEVRCLQALDAERLLIATDLGGLFVYDGTRIAPFRTEADAFIRKNQLYTFAVRGDIMALGTVQEGIVVLNTQGQIIRYVSRKEGLQNNTILSMTFDRSDNLWVGLDQGIDYVQLASPRQYLSKEQTDFGVGYVTLRTNDRYYFGTNQGLYYSKIQGTKDSNITGFDHSSPFTLQLVDGSMGQVWSLSEIDGTVFCCHNRGLFVVDDGRVKPLCTDEGFWKVHQLPDGRIIAGSYSGFRVIAKSEVRGQWTVSKVNGFEDTAFRWQVDATGTIWAVANSGVVRLSWDDPVTLNAQLVRSYDAAHNWFNISRLGGHILINSLSYCRVVNEEGELVDDKAVFDRLAGETYYALTYQDKNGNVLYVRDGTLYIRALTDSGYAAELPLYNGATDFVGGFENLYETDGGYIIGTLQGYCLLEKSDVRSQISDISTALPIERSQKSDVSPRIYLREVNQMNGDGGVMYGESLSGSGAKGELFRMPFDNQALRFEFAINRVPASNTQYAYRLLPRDKGFTPLTERAYYECSLLREGRYTLEVQCQTQAEDGSQVTLQQSWTFTILPPWYRTWWARVLLALFIVVWLTGLGYVLYVFADRSKRRTLHEQQLRILQLENDKTQTRLQAKSQELTRILHDEANRQEVFVYVSDELDKAIRELQTHNVKKADERLQALRQRLEQDNRDDSIDWQRFEENFDEVHAGFCKRLTELYPWMNKQERKLCIYIHMGMLTKEMAPLLGMSTRGVEMLRYRMRCKMDLDAQANLKDHLTKITSEP